MPTVPDDSSDLELDAIHIDVRVYLPGYIAWTVSEPVNLHRATERFIHHGLVPKPDTITIQAADQPLDAEILSFHGTVDESTKLKLTQPQFHDVSTYRRIISLKHPAAYCR